MTDQFVVAQVIDHCVHVLCKDLCKNRLRSAALPAFHFDFF